MQEVLGTFDLPIREVCGCEREKKFANRLGKLKFKSLETGPACMWGHAG